MNDSAINHHNLKAELANMLEESQRLTYEELDGTGDKVKRHERAHQMCRCLEALREEIDAVPEEDRDELESLWQAVERDLVFLIFAADEEQAQEPEPVQDIVLLARQINLEAFELAKQVIHGQIGVAERQSKFYELDQRIIDLVGLPGRDEPAVQRILNEAILELNFAYNGGNGASSLRVQQYIQEQGLEAG